MILSRCHIGKGVEKIRVWDDEGTYRVIYTARLVDAVYVLHAFQKKAKKGIATPKADVDLIKKRLGLAEQDYKTRSTLQGRDK